MYNGCILAITLDVCALILRHLIVAYSESKMLSIATLALVIINRIYIYYIGVYKHAYISLGYCITFYKDEKNRTKIKLW